MAEPIDRATLQRIRVSNANRVQFLAGTFVIVFGVSVLVDAIHMGTLVHHRFMLGGQVGGSFGVFALTRWTSLGRRHAAAVWGIGSAIVSAFGALHLAHFGAFDGPYFYGIYTNPPLFIAILMPLGPRVLTTAGGVVLYCVVYAAARPGLFSHPMAHIPVMYLLSIVGLCIALGHYVYGLQLGSFRRLAMMESATAALQAQLFAQPDSLEVRHHVARQLHDDMAQLLLGARLQLDGWARQRGSDDVTVQLGLVLDELARRAQKMLSELRAPLPNGSFPDELERLRLEYVRLGLAVELVLDDDLRLLGADRETVDAVLGAAREALTNALRHGPATEATLSIQLDEPLVRLLVVDNGRGTVTRLREGNGLRGMRERAERLGGTVDICDTEIGLQLTMTVPRHPRHSSTASGS